MKSVRRQYDAWARVYDLVWRRYANRTLDALLERACLTGGRKNDLTDEAKILDVGCGTGILEEKLVADGYRGKIVGVDASTEMIRRASEKLSNSTNVSFRTANAADLPFPDASFDAVVTASMLHYAPDPVAVLSEMRRVLRGNGTVYALDWCADFAPMRLRNALLRLLDPAHHDTYRTEKIHDQFEEAHLSMDHYETFRSGTYGLYYGEAVPS